MKIRDCQPGDIVETLHTHIGGGMLPSGNVYQIARGPMNYYNQIPAYKEFRQGKVYLCGNVDCRIVESDHKF
jgi:hypothetical protein